MKKNYIFLFLLMVISWNLSAVIEVKPQNPNEVIQNFMPTEAALDDMTLESFLALTPKKIRKKTGKRLRLKEIIALKVAQKKVKKAIKKGEASGKPKSQIVALILVILIGGLGIHRFYLGYTGIGIIQLLTLGGCGIWALIDLIMIATGNLGPKDGSDYDPTL